MSSKSAKDLSENKNIKTVKLHFHRFGRFLRYLKEHNANIEIINEDGHKFLYTGKSRDGNPSVEELVVDALNVSESTAGEYVSRKLGIDDTTHAYKDRIYNTARIINSISPYFKSDEPVDQQNEYLSKHNLFFIPRALDDSDRFEKHYKKILNKRREFTMEASTEYAPFNRDWHELIYMEGKKLGRLADSISDYIGNVKARSLADYRNLNSDLQKLIAAYLDSLENTTQITPNYHTFSKFFDKDSARRSNRYSEAKYWAMQERVENIEKLLPLRYEILWYMESNIDDLSTLPNSYLLIPYLCQIEYDAFHWVILESSVEAMKDLRFIVFGMNKAESPDLQVKSITINALSTLLSFYNLKGDLSKIFVSPTYDAPSNAELLKAKIYKYPDRHGVVQPFDKEDILRYVGNIYKEHFYNVITNTYFFKGDSKRVSEIW